MEIKLPFERNNYFWGKLLSAGDFQSEQKYFNEKRQLLNRLLHNYGILCGLNVIKADDRTISVEMGAALDYRGREIIIDTPLTKRLSLIDGFLYSNQKNYCYLCIEYSESPVDEVHSLTAGGTNHNMVREGCRLFITYDEYTSGFNLYEDTQVIFQNKDLLITQTVPRYVAANSRFMIKINVRRLTPACKKIKFVYSLDSDYIKLRDGNLINISFDEDNFRENDSYELYTMLRAASPIPQKDIIELTGLKVYLDDALICDKPSGQWNIGIVDGSIKDYIQEEYFKLNMEDMLNESESSRIYLAKIYYASGENTYAIDRVINAPFKQYIKNNLFNDLSYMPEANISAGASDYDAKKLEIRIDEILKSYVSLAQMQPSVSSGIETLDFGLKSAKSKRAYSKPIIHSLGKGLVHIALGLVADRSVIYGDSRIFDPDSRAEISLAAMVNEDGTFVIGARINGDAATTKIKVKWTAVKCASDEIKHFNYEKKMSISPDVTKIKCGESLKFELNTIGIDESESVWSVKEKEGGHINSAGLYTAPSLSGIYEINVKNGALEAKAYAIVG